MAETNINLLFAKINIKRDTKHYAPWDVINPQILNPFPADAKACKLTPSTTLFFKKIRCAEFNFGWRKIKTKPKKTKEKTMYKKNIYFTEREQAAVERSLGKKRYDIKKDKKLTLLHENRAQRKAMSFWQKAQVFFVEAQYDISRFFEDDKDPRWYHYNQLASTPGDKLTAFFLKKNKKNKENKNRRFMDMEDEMEKMEIEEEKSIRQGIQHVFKPRQARIPEPMREQIIEIEEMPLPDAPVQPPRNPEHQDGTTINNISINFTCTIS